MGDLLGVDGLGPRLWGSAVAIIFSGCFFIIFFFITIGAPITRRGLRRNALIIERNRSLKNRQHDPHLRRQEEREGIAQGFVRHRRCRAPAPRDDSEPTFFFRLPPSQGVPFEFVLMKFFPQFAKFGKFFGRFAWGICLGFGRFAWGMRSDSSFDGVGRALTSAGVFRSKTCHSADSLRGVPTQITAAFYVWVVG